MAMSDAIVTQGLTKYYGRQRVVDTLDLRIPCGSVYGLLGRNGAGKSTTIKMLLGLVHPDRGRTTLFSSHILSDVERVADRIGVLVDGVLRVDCPTDEFKQSVKKIVLEFGRVPPDFPA